MKPSRHRPAFTPSCSIRVTLPSTCSAVRRAGKAQEDLTPPHPDVHCTFPTEASCYACFGLPRNALLEIRQLSPLSSDKQSGSTPPYRPGYIPAPFMRYPNPRLSRSSNAHALQAATCAPERARPALEKYHTTSMGFFTLTVRTFLWGWPSSSSSHSRSILALLVGVLHRVV